MPTTSSVPTTFDPYDEDSWFFGFMSRDDATELLTKTNETGAFLVRESTTAKGDLVLSVKENGEKVSHYIINRLQSDKSQQVCFKIGEQRFHDIPSLLTFYKLNNLDDTPLKFPVGLRELQVNQPTLPRKLPGLAKVIQSRIPNAYDKTALTLKEGEIVKVTKVDISGCCEGEVSGRKGHFPFNYVKFIDDQNEDERLAIDLMFSENLRVFDQSVVYADELQNILHSPAR